MLLMQIVNMLFCSERRDLDWTLQKEAADVEIAKAAVEDVKKTEVK